MRPLGIRGAWVAGLVWLAACAASDPFEPATESDARALERVHPVLREWIAQPPPGCALGSSGPTLDPRDAIRNARLAAIEALAADSLAIDVQSITGEGPDGDFELTAQSLSGTLADARVIALWAAVDERARPRSRVRQVFALACWPDSAPRELPDPDYPRWLLEAPAGPDEVCAVGIAGPTWRREDQRGQALADARRALAVALESRVEKRVLDEGRGVARIVREIDPSPAARARAAEADALEREWIDEAGTGPVGLAGVLYGLACIDD